MRTAEIRGAHDELAWCGYHRDVLHPVLSALAWPDVEFNLRWEEGGAPFRAIAVRQDRLPVLA